MDNDIQLIAIQQAILDTNTILISLYSFTLAILFLIWLTYLFFRRHK